MNKEEEEQTSTEGSPDLLGLIQTLAEERDSLQTRVQHLEAHIKKAEEIAKATVWNTKSPVGREIEPLLTRIQAIDAALKVKRDGKLGGHVVKAAD